MQLSAEDYFMDAEVAYFSDDIEGARAAFKRALDLDPDVRPQLVINWIFSPPMFHLPPPCHG